MRFGFKIIVFCLVGLAILAASNFLLAGNIVNTDTPSSTMYSIDDIYDLINNNPFAGEHSLSPTDSIGSSMHSVSDLYITLANLIQAEDLAPTSHIYLDVGPGEQTPAPIATTTKEFSPTTLAGTSTGYTLADIYDLIINNNRITTPNHTFAPSSGPADSGQSLTNIYEALSNLIDENDIVANVTYLGITGIYSSTYSVNFNSSGGTYVSAVSGIIPGATITLPAEPSRRGNTFEGWYTEIDGGGTQFTDSTSVAGNITVYAKWQDLCTHSAADDNCWSSVINANKWSTESIITGATSAADGESNTTVLANLAGDYPQADACASLVEDGYPAGTWYLPAEDELTAGLDAQFITDPPTVTGFNGTNGYGYWSSTESNQGESVYVANVGGVTFFQSYSKQAGVLPVRCLR